VWVAVQTWHVSQPAAPLHAHLDLFVTRRYGALVHPFPPLLAHLLPIPLTGLHRGIHWCSRAAQLPAGRHCHQLVGGAAPRTQEQGAAAERPSGNSCRGPECPNSIVPCPCEQHHCHGQYRRGSGYCPAHLPPSPRLNSLHTLHTLHNFPPPTNYILHSTLGPPRTTPCPPGPTHPTPLTPPTHPTHTPPPPPPPRPAASAT
jgi:hypothetical protein